MVFQSPLSGRSLYNSVQPMHAVEHASDFSTLYNLLVNRPLIMLYEISVPSIGPLSLQFYVAKAALAVFLISVPSIEGCK